MDVSETHRRIGAGLPYGFFVHDVHGRLLDVNEQSCIDLDYSREELLSLTINDISRGADVAENATKWMSASPGLAMNFREIALRKDGSTYPVEINLTCQMVGKDKLFVGLARQVGEAAVLPLPDEVAHPDVNHPPAAGSPSRFAVKNLLSRFSILTATDARQAAQALSTMPGVDAVQIAPGPVDIRANKVELAEIELLYFSTSVDFSCSISPSDRFQVMISLAGRAGVNISGNEYEASGLQAFIVAPGTSLNLNIYGGHRCLTLRVRGATLARKLGALTGRAPRDDVLVQTTLNMSREASEHLLHASLFLAETLDWLSMPSLALMELEQAVIVAILESSQGIHDRFLRGHGSTPIPRHVQVAEEYLETHWDRLISVEELAVVSGVAARTLFRSFNAHRGESPMQFARRVRLRHAQTILSSPAVDTTVMATAFLCGFSNAGQFARHYLKAFGEHPSQTLARHR